MGTDFCLLCLQLINDYISFIYWLLLCADACYRFKNRLRSSETKDPTLGPGWAFFNDHGPYLDFVKDYATQEEVSPICNPNYVVDSDIQTQISTCSGFAAIHLQNLKGMKGHRTSGVGGICCARQDCWRANGLGDLQKGERCVVF